MVTARTCKLQTEVRIEDDQYKASQSRTPGCSRPELRGG